MRVQLKFNIAIIILIIQLSEVPASMVQVGTSWLFLHYIGMMGQMP